MSDSDSEMTDLSQADTQSQTQTQTQSISSQFTLSQCSGDVVDSWAKLLVYSITSKRFGRLLQGYDFHLIKRIDLTEDKTTVGRVISNICVEEFLSVDRLESISAVHFSILKNDVNDPFAPIFLEDTSLNGTYIKRESPSKQSGKISLKSDRLDNKVRRYILAHKDIIFIQKNPTIAFEFRSNQLNNNGLPDEINKTYHVGRELGSGACGTVYFVQNRRTCEPYALKFTKEDENALFNINREVDLLKSLQMHPCILKLFGVESRVGSMAIYLEFMQGGDLLSRIQKYKYFSESLTKFLFYQMCAGVQYLHSERVTHRDLKPENILLATTDEFTLVKISDFGLSKRIRNNTQLATTCGTLMYLAPEVRTSNNYTNKVDVWSLGVILFNCLSGRYPFSKQSCLTNPTDIQYDLLKRKNATDMAINVVRDTLQIDVNLRPSIKDLMNNQWLSDDDQYIQMAKELIEQRQ